MIGFRWDDDDVIPDQAPGSDGDLFSLEPSQCVMADYRRTLGAPRRGRVVTARTKLTYIRAASALMVIALDDDRSEPNQRDVRRLLWRTPGAPSESRPLPHMAAV